MAAAAGAAAAAAGAGQGLWNHASSSSSSSSSSSLEVSSSSSDSHSCLRSREATASVSYRTLDGPPMAQGAVGTALGCGRQGLASSRHAVGGGVANVRHFSERKGRRSGRDGRAAWRIGASDARGRGGGEREKVLEAEMPRRYDFPRVGVVDLGQAWEVLRQDVLYLDWRARQDVDAIKFAHDRVVRILNPLAREETSVSSMRQELARLQEELARAHDQALVSEWRAQYNLKKLAEVESSEVGEPSLKRSHIDSGMQTPFGSASTAVENPSDLRTMRKLNVSGRVPPYQIWLKNFWYPVAFTGDIGADTMIPFESFEEPWVLFRGEDGRVGCVRDECAHRACPLSLGTVSDGRIQCPYHGWQYATNGECKKMPSVRPTKASVRALPCIERDGMVWIWPGDEMPGHALPALNPPANFTIHAEIIIEMPVEHGLLMENLLDLAHAPFTHTSTFAKGWAIPNFVRFKTPTAAFRGNWDPYPIDMEFQPPCMVLSTIGLEKPGQLDGMSAAACPKHLHQLHVCMPSTRGKTRLLYRMALDFVHWAKYVPFIDHLWTYLANQVLNEDLRLVEGQQDRMVRGANVWGTPVAYDKLGVRYRQWRNAVEAGNLNLPFDSL